MDGWFVTGTDTGCGKTLVSAALVHRLRTAGRRMAVMKPVASGCERTGQGLRNADAEVLLEACGLDLSYTEVNPYAFAPPIAPHIAAARAGQVIELSRIVAGAEALRSGRDGLLVEGAGGWRVPLGEQLDMAGLARALQLPVILVVGMRLGCINHALLTAEAVLGDGCQLAGWVANRVDPRMAEFDANLETLRQRIPAPCLGVLPHLDTVDPRQAAPLLALP
jgi:dethiobiotin synthetase